MYHDITKDHDAELWTVALTCPSREVIFGVFKSVEEAIEAVDSGLVKVLPDEKLSLRRIRDFPRGPS